ncbi:MAG: hypothetical protein KKG76_03195 [Euryarchaeota archaeon]|nr:hypothetical protein [Euryarchaeota archaeon]
MRAIIKCFFVLLLIFSIMAGSAEAASGQLRNLTEVGIFTTHKPHDAEFYKDYLYIADGNSVLVYNMTDPESPKLINKFTDFNEPRQVDGLSISEDRLYTASGAGWVNVLNISDPETPEKLYQFNYLDSSGDVAVQGDYMYVADANAGLLIFDLYDRKDPSLIGMFYILRSNISGSLHGWGGISVEVSGNYAFLSGASNKGFYIIDISDKTAPREVYHSLGKNVYDIALSGNDVYLARSGGTSDFDKLNISNIYAPVITGSFSIAGTADRSAVVIHPSGDYLYAASEGTWHIFMMEDTLPPQIIIEEPGEGEVFTERTIEVSGRASDRSGVAEVLVNGQFAGTESWHQTITLVEGINSINITAFDKKGFHKTEILKISYHLPEQTIISAPEIEATVNGTEMSPAGRLVILNLIYIAFIVIFLIVIAYLGLKSKRIL